MKRDYKLPATPAPGGRPLFRRHHLLWLGSILSIVTIFVSLAPFEAAATRHTVQDVQQAPSGSLATPQHVVEEQLPLPATGPDSALEKKAAISPDEPATVTGDASPWREVRIKRGDTLAAVFNREGLSATTLHTILHSDKQAQQLKKIRPGETIRLRTSEDGLQELVHVQSPTRQLHVKRSTDGYEVQPVEREYERRLAYSQGRIDDSLFLAAQRAGLAESVTMDLAAIFGWDIDFALDIRRGDEFRLVYEELWLDGEQAGVGNILAAEFINQGRNVRAVRYTTPKGDTSYYTPEGLNMRKAFLRSPVDFRRISSRFGKRKHPILNSMRMHTGVDYAAARGTPVRATGDGKIIHRGRKGGYGKTVIIRHGSTYTTLYAHLNNYNRNARNGSRVKQGQIIGYVGSTGRATGPHLHYEFRVHGAHRNPLTVKLPSASPLDKRYKNDFINQTSGLIAQLDGLRRTQVALRDN
jgi:murein DD-endopeptidase MepM/ murein hydrolase activator NlpD